MKTRIQQMVLKADQKKLSSKLMIQQIYLEKSVHLRVSHEKYEREVKKSQIQSPQVQHMLTGIPEEEERMGQ